MLQPSPGGRFHHVYFGFLRTFSLKMNAILGVNTWFLPAQKETYFTMGLVLCLFYKLCAFVGLIGTAANTKVGRKFTLANWPGFAANSKFASGRLSLKRAAKIPARMWPRKYPRMNADCPRHAAASGAAECVCQRCRRSCQEVDEAKWRGQGQC